MTLANASGGLVVAVADILFIYLFIAVTFHFAYKVY